MSHEKLFFYSEKLTFKNSKLICINNTRLYSQRALGIIRSIGNNYNYLGA